WVALARPIGLASVAKRSADAGRGLALRGVEVRVARAERQAVGLTDGRHHLDLCAEVEVAHQPLHDRDLLGVFLAEVGTVWIDRRQQLGDHRGDSLEMSWSGRALEGVGQA